MKEKTRCGQPTLLTPEKRDEIVGIIEAGNYESVAWMMAGIGETTYYRWKDRGLFEEGEEVPEDDLIYWEFREAIKGAIAKAQAESVGIIRNDKSWQAAMTYLERKFPELWGKKDRLTIEAHIMAGDVVREIAAAIDERAPEIKEKFDAVMEWMARKK